MSDIGLSIGNLISDSRGRTPTVGVGFLLIFADSPNRCKKTAGSHRTRQTMNGICYRRVEKKARVSALGSRVWKETEIVAVCVSLKVSPLDNSADSKKIPNLLNSRFCVVTGSFTKFLLLVRPFGKKYCSFA